MRKVLFFDYPGLFEQNRADYLRIFEDVCSRGAYILQKDLAEFESNLAKFLGVKHALGVADGTNALIIGLMAMGIGPGDEVVVPSHTYVASASSIIFVGAKPVLADCGPDHLIDPVSAASRVTAKTKAIMPVQLNGRTCNMDPILELAREKNLKIIEDSAQGLGSKFKGKSAGTFGVCGTFSFYPAKLLGCFGDGGGIVTNDDAVAEKLRQLRDHGRDSNGLVSSWGTNSRLDNLQAAFLDFKLKTFDKEIARRREIASMYQSALSEIDDVTLPPAPSNDNHFDCYQNYEMESGRRDELRKHLSEQGISTLIQWGGKALHQFPALGLSGEGLPNTERLFKRCLMLPMNTVLTNDDVSYVCDSIRKFYGIK